MRCGKMTIALAVTDWFAILARHAVALPDSRRRWRLVANKNDSTWCKMST